MKSHLLQAFAMGLWDIQAFLDKSQSKGGQGFRLKLHETNPDAPLSPFYLNLRLVRSNPEALSLAATIFQEMVAQQGYVGNGRPSHMRLADVPTSITPVVGALVIRLGIGMVSPREAKTYGTQSSIDGSWEPNAPVLLFDDLITTAESKISAIQTLEPGNEQNGPMKVEHVFVLVDREQGGADQLIAKGCKLTAACGIYDILNFYRRERLITHERYREIESYLIQNSEN